MFVLKNNCLFCVEISSKIWYNCYINKIAFKQEKTITDKELKKLKDDLWHAADMLRAGAHIAANKYGQPILGLIFLRYADILFKQHHDEIQAEFEKYKTKY